MWRELPGRRDRAAVALAMGLFATAVVLDFFEGLDPAHRWNVYASAAARADVASFTTAQFGRPPYDAIVHFSKTVEEALEIVAMALLWSALLGPVARLTDGARITVRPAVLLRRG